jgi:predicted site-specific integrase-resolvase
MINNEEKTFISIREASRISGIEPQTLRKMADTKKIGCFKTPSGQRKFNLFDLQKMFNNNSTNSQDEKNTKNNYLYTRVSSKKQLDDLLRQNEFIRNYSIEYASYTLISDIASGINFKRKGIETILESCMQRTIGEVVVAHKDRLSRFGYDLFKLIIEKSGGKITVINSDENKSSEQELAEDLLSIVHIFSCRQMGKRKYKRNDNENNKDTTETNHNTT